MAKNNRVYDSMLDAPHLLVVGATGSGKSVLINALIYNIIKETPENNQLVLIDPKRVELFPFCDCPHVLKYACEPDEMMESLRSVVSIMEERFVTMQKKRIKRSDEYDIYVVIDEYADLMDVCKKPAEDAIIRLAQLGRAAGIHIIAATQNCTVKVVNTRIKSNFPARVCLKTATVHDSINVIGSRGAEKLPSYGKGYFLSGNACDIVDINMIPDEEINKLMDSYSGRENPYKIKIDEIPIDEKVIEKIIHHFGSTRLTSVKSLESEYNLSPEEAERYARELINRGFLARTCDSDRLTAILQEEEEVGEELTDEEFEKLLETIEEKVQETNSVNVSNIEETKSYESTEDDSEKEERVNQFYEIIEEHEIIVEKLKDLISFYYKDHSISYKAFQFGWYDHCSSFNELVDAFNELKKECYEFLSQDEAIQIREYITNINIFVDDINENLKEASRIKRLEKMS